MRITDAKKSIQTLEVKPLSTVSVVTSLPRGKANSHQPKAGIFSTKVKNEIVYDPLIRAFTAKVLAVPISSPHVGLCVHRPINKLVCEYSQPKCLQKLMLELSLFLGAEDTAALWLDPG